MSTFPNDLLSVDDLDGEQLTTLLDLADTLKAQRGTPRQDLAGRTVALVFEKPSTRTRVSFQVAVTELSGSPLPLSATELQLGRGESIADTAEVLSRYVHAIVVRTFGQERIEELAAAADVPVVNALTDLEHPCQAFADLQTVREEFGGFSGRRLTYVGDGNNVAHSLLLAGAKVGLSVDVAHPEGYGPDTAVVERARRSAAATGARISITTAADEVVSGTDVVYTDVWASMGQEEETRARSTAFAPYQVSAELFSLASPDAVFLHCLPAHRGEEVDAEVIDGSSSRVFSQAENRLHAQKALLARLLA